MNNCIKMQELISEYIDNEISEADRKILEAHLDSCESCSAIMELYKEMSASVTASMVSVPESLCENVMGKILSGESGNDAYLPDEPVSTDSDDKKKKKSSIIYIKRFLPAVACLAVILLVWPFVQNLNNGPNYDEPIPATTSAMPEAFEETAQAEIDAHMNMPVTDEMEAPAAGGAGADFGITAPVAPAAPIAPAPAMDQPSEQAAPEHVQRHDVGVAEFARPAQEDPPVDIDIRAHADFHSAGEQVPAPHEWIELEDEMPDSETAYLDTILVFEQLIRESYVWIEITGQLPEILEHRPSIFAGDWTVWEQLFRISREEALVLIEEIRGQEGVTITQGDINSEYAVVLFTPNR